MLRLKSVTSPAWVEAVLADFGAFLADHAACERKAASSALVLVSHFRHHRELVGAMIDLAREELEHFQLVYGLLDERGLELAGDTKDPYVGGITMALGRTDKIVLLDRLLVSAVIEARACERLGLVAEALPPGALKDTYVELTRAEARHHGLFARLARVYFPEDEVRRRLDEILTIEADVVARLPVRPAIH